MNKSQIISDLQSRYKNVGTPELLESVADVKQYLVNFLEVNTDGTEALKRNAFFYTFKEGTGEEIAYYKTDASAKETIPMTEFRKITISFLDEQVTKGEVLKYNIIVIDETNEYAEVNCLVPKDLDVTWQKYVVYRSSDKEAKYSKLV